MGFPCSLVGKGSALQETWVRSLGWEDPLEKEMATHSSILAWKIAELDTTFVQGVQPEEFHCPGSLAALRPGMRVGQEAAAAAWNHCPPPTGGSTLGLSKGHGLWLS